ncbi:MAG: PIG-L deacetylase family protein [Chthoniobacterales bacterium]
MARSIAILSVHPDDETLGCGGTLLKHQSEGDSLHWLILTRAHPPQWPRDILDRKQKEIADVAKAYGMKSWKQCDFPAAKLETVSVNDRIQAIHAFIEEAKPEIVYLVHGGDVNSDHSAAFEAVCAVLKPFHLKRLGVKRVLSYETLSSTEAAPALAHRAFLPIVFSDISPWLERKIEIMALYATETHKEPMPRSPSSIRALARWRGATVACEYAEAFMPLREIF